MNKLLIAGGLILALGAIVLGIGNPTQEEYQQFGAEQLSLYIQEEGCTKIPSSLGGFLQIQCKELVKEINPQLQDLIAKNTQRKNFVLFSIYVTDLTLPTPLSSYHFETVGGVNQFWVIKAEEQNSSN